MSDPNDTLHLTLFQKNKAPEHLSLSPSLITIGRATTCSIPLTDSYLSRHHATIEFATGEWVLADGGSANGTYLNGMQLDAPSRIRPGDRITLGDTELAVESGEPVDEDTLSITVDEEPVSAGLTISTMDLSTAIGSVDDNATHLTILNQLATELLDDRPTDELFEFIVDRVMHLLDPSRVALGILGSDGLSFQNVILKMKGGERGELSISQTLLNQVVENRKVLSFTDVSESSDLMDARSIVAQEIRSALCAPLIVRKDVMGVLYLDYVLRKRTISQEDITLAGKIAQIAARKLETTILREESQAKQKMDQEMNTAFLIQSRLLPATPPAVEGFAFDGRNRSSQTVGGDYYDFVVRPDGRVYFIIADVSGKGITAALVMAGVAAAFNTLTNHEPSPSGILKDLNQTLARKTDASMFVTAFCGVLDPTTSEIVFSNAGHNPPFIVGSTGAVEQLELRPGLVLGFLPEYEFVDEKLLLPPGSTLYLYTDGITEAIDASGEEFNPDRLVEVLARNGGMRADQIAQASIDAVDHFAAGVSQADDITIVCMQRTAGAVNGDGTLPR